MPYPVGGVGLCCDAAVSLKKCSRLRCIGGKGHWQATADGADPGRGRYGGGGYKPRWQSTGCFVGGRANPLCAFAHQWRRRSRPPAGCGRKTAFAKAESLLCWQSCWLPGKLLLWSVTMAPTRRRGSIGAVRSLITENKRRYKHAGTGSSCWKASCRWMPLRWMRPKNDRQNWQSPRAVWGDWRSCPFRWPALQDGYTILSGTPIFWCLLQIMVWWKKGCPVPRSLSPGSRPST